MSYPSSFSLDTDSHSNHTSSISIHDTDDPLFHLCWRRQSCQYCLKGDFQCSWCPISQTCAPNPSHFPILSPIVSENICPLGYKERWELRTTGLGCNVSSITFLTAIVAVLSTLVGIGLAYGAVWGRKRVVRWWREREERSGGNRGNRGWKEKFLGILGMMSRRGRRLSGSGDEGLNEDREYEEGRPLLG